ncbi:MULTISPECIES: ferric reductase-like transmembrane domain-containing protein [unclassified Cellulophaga]|uniref:ferric reductase-like transmembrane domain-containing protein n=1 Tax=unclassified Cellulophaga TaxID=2634405 RepID=UPI001C4EF4E5|nr:ferric reductase-like transmembrane domain-containing protein [Cellulophaga sp. HaHa_2_1]QXP52573.1 ferric reductase-like transmembrane domain-containing protein [Cellulophaga sp. HaHa_2_1]
MRFIKKNYGWFIVTVLAILPLFILANFLEVEYASDFAVSLKESAENNDQSTLELLYHISGEFAIRWMTAVLSCTPFFILFGVTNLYVRQAMGIATAIWSIIHFIIFCAAEGFLETFTQVNYMAGFLAVLLLVPLFVTSNRKAMRRLKSKWKKLQSLAYIIILLSIVHVAILDKTWMIYAIIVGLGFILRIPLIKAPIIAFRKRRLE